MADIRQMMDAATSHEFGTHGLARPFFTARYVGHMQPLRVTKPHYRLHSRLIGGGVLDMDKLHQWCVEYGGRRTKWEFSSAEAIRVAGRGHFRYVMHPRTV